MAPRDQYIDALAPLRISILSMSAGLRSRIRLKPASRPPVTAPTPPPTAALLNTTPSTTKSGDTDPRIVFTPRRRNWKSPGRNTRIPLNVHTGHLALQRLEDARCRNSPQPFPIHGAGRGTCREREGLQFHSVHGQSNEDGPPVTGYRDLVSRVTATPYHEDDVSV